MSNSVQTGTESDTHLVDVDHCGRNNNNYDGELEVPSYPHYGMSCINIITTFVNITKNQTKMRNRLISQCVNLFERGDSKFRELPDVPRSGVS